MYIRHSVERQDGNSVQYFSWRRLVFGRYLSHITTYKGVKWVYLAQDKDQCQTPMITVTDFLVK